MSKDLLPHLHLPQEGKIRPVVIVCGDPGRASAIAARCESFQELAFNREYRTFDCFYKQKYFTVCSHGVGSSGAAICFEELIKGGAKMLCRAGTCGSLQHELYKQGDIIIATSACRDDGTTDRLVPPGFPAVADYSCVVLLEQIAKKKNVPHTVGMVVASDTFYPGVLPNVLETYAKAGVAGVEMENGVLFVIAALRKCRACALSTIDGAPLKWDEGNYDPSGEVVAKGKERMIDVVLEWAAEMSSETNPLA